MPGEGLLKLNTAKGKGKEDECDSFSKSAKHYFISGSSDKNEQNILDRVLGDTSVMKNRAPHTSAPTNSQIVRIEGLSHHSTMIHSDRVYRLITTWIEEADLSQGDQELAKEGTTLLISPPIQEASMTDSALLDSPKQALIAGAIDFIGSTYDKTIESVETIHYSLTEEPFFMVQKLPVVSQIAKPIEAAHRNILDNLYRSLRRAGRLIHKVSADITPKHDATMQAKFAHF